jgi:tetratricopeptide (TPR) repeat protein
MQKAAARYPGDDQIAVLYAESLMDLQPWDYWEAAGAQPKGRTEEIVGLLEKVLARAPNHPGAIHYYIHLTEASSDPKRAVPYAKRLGRLMPGAGHVVHMPFHTFFRVGMYKEAVEANRLAVKVDEAYIARSLPIGIYPQGYYPHNVHSLMVSAQMAGEGATVIESANKLGRSCPMRGRRTSHGCNQSRLHRTLPTRSSATRRPFSPWPTPGRTFLTCRRCGAMHVPLDWRARVM